MLPFIEKLTRSKGLGMERSKYLRCNGIKHYLWSRNEMLIKDKLLSTAWLAEAQVMVFAILFNKYSFLMFIVDISFEYIYVLV